MGLDVVMLLAVKDPVNSVQIECWANQLAHCVGPDKFFIREQASGFLKAHGILETVVNQCDKAGCEKYPGVPFQKYFSLFKVHVVGRYYAIGYPRGDVLTYCMAAECLEANIPGAEIYYGHDGSDEFDLFNQDERAKLKKHFYTDW